VVTDKRKISHAAQAGRPIRRTTITGLGTYVPPRLLTNADLEKMVDTSSEWILQRTGIRERHIVDPGVGSSDLGREAAIKALAQAGVSPEDIEFIIVGTVTSSAKSAPRTRGAST
jgi:3-oxoacyl-[acyl-carrier-protein] synthase-3